MELRLMGLSFQQIANSPWPIGDNKGRMYTSRMAAHKAVKREMEWAEHEKTVVYEKAIAYHEQHDKEAAMERELDLERLQLLLHPMMIKALAGDTEAVYAALKIITVRGVLLGYLPSSVMRNKPNPDNKGCDAISQMLKAAKERNANKAMAVH